MTQVLIDRATLEQALEALLDTTGLPSTSANSFDNRIMGIRVFRAALAGAETTGCLWSKDPDFEMGDTYDSACGEKWSFIDGGPAENRVRFCQGCGKPVKLIKETK